MPRGNAVPAIVRDFNTSDGTVPVRHTTKDTVSFRRGWGDTGYRVQVVEHDCPDCMFDRMIRRVDVSAERPDEVRYWCLNPNCAYFVGQTLSHACHGSPPQLNIREPVVNE